MMNKLKNLGIKIREVTSNKDFMRKVASTLVAVAYIMFIVALASEFAFADTTTTSDDNNILSNVSTLLSTVESSILQWSAVAVVIGVGVGAMMKKFSMGKQDKIEMGNKLMKDSIIAFAILNATPRIVNFITSKIGKGTENINT